MMKPTILKYILLLLASTGTTAAFNRELHRPVGPALLKTILTREPKPLNIATMPPPGGTVAIPRDQPKQPSLLERHPFSSAIAITTVNAVAADLLTQCVFEAGPWNPQRSFLFAAFGFLYQGMAQYAIVNGVWEKFFPGTSTKAVVSKICGMNLLSDPLLFMPTFYIFKEAMVSGLTFGTIKAALLGYKANCLLDWRNSWMVWFPGHAVTYGVMPAHKRIPWMAFLSFFYMVVLSLTRGATGV